MNFTNIDRVNYEVQREVFGEVFEELIDLIGWKTHYTVHDISFEVLRHDDKIRIKIYNEHYIT